jgi:hypothetical protein
VYKRQLLFTPVFLDHFRASRSMVTRLDKMKSRG